MNGFALAATTNDFFESFRRYSSGSTAGYKGWFLVTILILAAAWGGLYFWDLSRRKRRTGIGEPGDLLRELCDAHHLSREERHALKSVAETARLPHPGALFVDAELLRKHAASSPHAAVLQSLAQRLYSR